MVTAASLVALTVPFRVVMASSLVTGNAALVAAGQDYSQQQNRPICLFSSPAYVRKVWVCVIAYASYRGAVRLRRMHTVLMVLFDQV